MNGISEGRLGKPNFELALEQHKQYVNALKQIGLEVIVVDPDEDYPDSTFVEDACLITPKCAIIANPGASSRKGETATIREAVEKLDLPIEHIEDPGTLDAGDIMMVDDHYYVGLSGRTNEEGTKQLTAILKKHGMTSSTIELKSVLHLKTGISYLEDDNLLATGEFLTKPELKKFNILEVSETESYAANSVWLNGHVLVPKGFPITENRIANMGYNTIAVDVSEFRKLDGGLSCLSLRF